MGVVHRSWVRRGSLGKGTFGAVSLAVDCSTGAVFAVKSVDLDASPAASIRSLENEIAVLKSIRSPHVVAYLGDDCSVEQQHRYRNLHIEYMPGGTATDLAGVWKDGEKEQLSRSYARCAALGLRDLHEAWFVHGDVKGRNLLVGHAAGTAKLADLGSATRILGSTSGRRLVQGTPLWMAPEVARGEAATPSSDVWSLGCTVIEMVTARAPWSQQGLLACDPAAAMFQIAFGEEVPDFPAGMSEVGRDFLDKCLKRDPVQRWSCEQLLQHPFLAEEAAAEQSPRCVLDCWMMSSDGESDSGIDFGGSVDGSCSSLSGSELLAPASDAKKRLRKLACISGAIDSWGGDDG